MQIFQKQFVASLPVANYFEIHFRMLRYVDKPKHKIIVALTFQIYCSNDIFLVQMINNAKSTRQNQN